jgi:carboxypeptidase Q
LPYAELFEPLGAHHFVLGGGGADISPLTKAGMLGLAVRPDTSHYFDLHHSPADTIDKIAPFHLERNAAAMALMAYILAERDLPEPTPATSEASE